MAPEAPSAAELEANPIVQAAFQAAWADLFVDDPALRHEEGGWAYVHELTRRLAIRRSLPGGQRAIDLTNPPEVADHYLVALFHTHPNPTEDGWNPEPSVEDREFAAARGLPNFVVSDMGVYVTGPARRVGGLTGFRGYPL